MIEFTLPAMKLIGSQNSREHWAVKSRREAPQKRAALAATQAHAHALKGAIVITLTRVGPRVLDDDNAVACLKGVRDQVAKALRIDDGSPLVSWRYEQAKGEYAVRVRIEIGGS